MIRGWALALAMVAVASSATGDVGWTRSVPEVLPADTCQELVLDARGEGHLELRFTEAGLPKVGPDPRTSGVSLLISGTPAAPARMVLLHPTGPFGRRAILESPIRWIRRGNQLCFGSGTSLVACGVSAREPRTQQRVALGRGWQSRTRGCPNPPRGESEAIWIGLAAIALGIAALAWGLRRGRWVWLAALAPSAAYAPLATLSPWALDPRLGLLAIALPIGAALACAFRRRGTERLAYVALAGLASAWCAVVPHPVRLASPATVAAAPAGDPSELWADPATWNPLSPHQRLAFREEPFADLIADAEETWLVVGGSVAFGVEVTASATFTAEAERQLRAAGHRVRLRNGAVPAWNLAQIDAFLRAVGDRLPIHGLVVVSVLNNAGFRLWGPIPGSCEWRLASATACALGRSPLHAAWAKYFLPKPGNEERMRATLRALVGRERALGRSVILLDEATRWQLTNDLRGDRDERYRSALREEAAALGLELHSVAEAVAEVPEDERFIDAIHLAPAGHTAVGVRLAEILSSQIGSGKPAAARDRPAPSDERAKGS